jgi:hypothetical protein
MKKLIAILLLGAFASAAYAAEDFICEIKASGGDYTTLSAWETAIDSDLTLASSKIYAVSATNSYLAATDDGDTVTFTGGGTGVLKHVSVNYIAYITDVSGTVNAGTVTCDTSGHTFTISDTGQQVRHAVAECYNDWPAGLSDNVTLNGWTTDSNNYVKITTPLSERHDGKVFDGSGNITGFMLKSAASYQNAIHIIENYTVVEGLILDCNNRISSAGVAPQANYSVTKDCIFRRARAGGFAYAMPSAGFPNNNLLVNCVFAQNYGGCIRVYSYGNNQRAYSCTFANNTGTAVYFHGSGSPVRTHYLKNCLFSNNGNTIYNSNPNATIDVDYCASDDGDVADFGGSGNRTNQTFQFVNATSNDYHLAENDGGAATWGTNLASDAFYPFDTDVNGDSRVTPWDIGFDQVTTGIVVTTDRYFVGLVDSDWNDTGNWSWRSGSAGGYSVPGTGNKAIFDVNSPDCTLDTTITAGDVEADTTFANTFNANGYNFTTEGDVDWYGGTFDCSNSTVRFQDNTTFSNCNLTLSSGTTYSDGNGTYTVDFEHVTNFNANGGIFYMDVEHGREQNFYIGTNNALHTWTLRNQGASSRCDLKTDVTVSNDFNIIGLSYGNSQFHGAGKVIYLHGDITMAGNAAWCSSQRAQPVVRMVGIGDQSWFQYDDAGGRIPKLIVDKPSGNFIFDGNTSNVYCRTGHTFEYITADGVLSGTNNTVLYFRGYGTSTMYLTVPGSLTLPVGLRFDRYGAGTLVCNGTVGVEGDLIFRRQSSHSNGGWDNGTYEVEGDFDYQGVNTGTGSDNDATFKLVGGNNQDITYDDTNLSSGGLTIDKTNGTVTLTTDFDIGNVKLDLADGAFDLDGNDLSLGGTLTIDDTFRLRGTETWTYGALSFNTNTSTVVYHGAGTAIVTDFPSDTFWNLTFGSGKTHNFATGLVDKIVVRNVLGSDAAVHTKALLRSTTPDTQWYIELDPGGTNTLLNTVDVQDSNATYGQQISAVGSTDSGNNNNWFFGTPTSNQRIPEYINTVRKRNIFWP